MMKKLDNLSIFIKIGKEAVLYNTNKMYILDFGFLPLFLKCGLSKATKWLRYNFGLESAIKCENLEIHFFVFL